MFGFNGLSSLGNSIVGGISDAYSSVTETIGKYTSGPNMFKFLDENPEPKFDDYETAADYEDALEGWEMRKSAAEAADAALPKPQRAAEKLDLEKPAPGISGGTGPGPISMPTRQPSYGAIKSPYEMVPRGLGTQDLTKLLLDSLKAQARARVTSMSAPRIRGLLG